MKKTIFKRVLSSFFVCILCVSFLANGTVTVFAAETDQGALTGNNETRASGISYGPWFGKGTDSWNADIKTQAGAASAIIGAIAFCVPYIPARTLAGEISGALSLLSFIAPGTYTYGTVEKEYREAHYSDGTFAYFQTHYTIKASANINGVDKYLGIFHEYYEGSSPMMLENS